MSHFGRGSFRPGLGVRCYFVAWSTIFSQRWASPAWDPLTSEDVTKLEKVQRQAARFVHNSYYDTWLRPQDGLKHWMGVIATQKKSGPIDNTIQNTVRIGGARH